MAWNVQSCANSVIDNYKTAFKSKYGRNTKLTDNEVYDVIVNEPTWSTGDEQDLYTVESMKEKEKEKERNIAND